MRKKPIKNPIIECACGCKNTLLKYDSQNRERKYIYGHNANLKKNYNFIYYNKNKTYEEMYGKEKALFLRGCRKKYWKENNPMKRIEIKNKVRTKLKGRIVWNKGLTKDIDKRIKISAKKCSLTKKRLFAEGKLIFRLKKGEENINWQGGKSFEPYGIEFNNQLKEQIRARDNYRCQECFREQDELFKKCKNGKISKCKLDTHHIDFNKKNNNPNNLISLCQRCHTQTQSNRQKWTNYFQDKIQRKVIENS